MKRIILTLLLSTSPAFAADHPCAEDAKLRAALLLKFHFVINAKTLPSSFVTEKVENLYIDPNVTVLQQVRSASGKSKFDVLNVSGAIYKANYRIRMIYTQGVCTLMGQEVFEESDP